MKRYTDADIVYAQELRRKYKHSFAELERITKIPATTIRNWCKNEKVGTRWDILLITNERKRQSLKQSEILNIKRIDTHYSKLLLAIMYWCEGSKYPSENSVDFVNSDPILIKLFLDLFRKAFAIEEKRLRVRLQIHDTHNYEEVKSYWSALLLIPQSQFIKPTITQKRNGKHRHDYIGTCTIRYPDFRLQLKLIGIYETFVKNYQKYLAL